MLVKDWMATDLITVSPDTSVLAAAQVMKKITGSGAAALLWMANVVLIPVVAFYLMRDWDRLMDKALAVMPLAWQEKVSSMVTESHEVVGAFLRGQFLVMCSLGMIYSIGLWLVGVQLALLLGLLAGMASIVPYLGFTVGIISSCLVAYVQFHDWSMLLWVVLVFGVGQTIESTLLTPAAEAEDLLQASIFFDFRCGFGEDSLIAELRQHLFASLDGWPGFFRHMTENALNFKPPLGFFRNFVVESKGRHRNAFDIKSAMTPIVDFARVYALKNRIDETNTMERLDQLRIKKIISPQEYEELEKAYSFLMQLRFVRQITAVMDDDTKPDNYINPKKLTHIEQTMLKEIFKRVEKFQSKMNFEFIGIA